MYIEDFDGKLSEVTNGSLSKITVFDFKDFPLEFTTGLFSVYRGVFILWWADVDGRVIGFIDNMPEHIREKLAGIFLHYDSEKSRKASSPVYRLYLYWHEWPSSDEDYYPCHRGEVVGPDGEYWCIVESMEPGDPPWKKIKITDKPVSQSNKAKVIDLLKRKKWLNG